MIDLRFETLAAFWVTTGIVVLLILWCYYDKRQRDFMRAEQMQTVFHCIKCKHIYSKKTAVGRCVCPKCGFENSQLQF